MYKFVKTKDSNNEFDKTNVTVEIPFNDVNLNDLCEAFGDFIKACGFFINNKHVEIIPDEDVNASMKKDEESPSPYTDDDLLELPNEDPGCDLLK